MRNWSQRRGQGPDAVSPDAATLQSPFDSVSAGSPSDATAIAEANKAVSSGEPAAISRHAPVKPVADVLRWLSPFDPVTVDEDASAVEAAVIDTPAHVPAAGLMENQAASLAISIPVSGQLGSSSAVGGWPEMPERMSGQGRFSGKPPRGAGIVAICIRHSLPSSASVCVVQKANGKCGFPKGGRGSGETILDGARREWLEETGIPLARLVLQPGAYIDDAFLGVRYLIASCAPANAASDDPDTCDRALGSSWVPPNEDPSDPDPIVKARWVPLSEALRSGGGGGLRREYVDFVRRAAQVVMGDQHDGRDERQGPPQAPRVNGRPRRWKSGASATLPLQ